MTRLRILLTRILSLLQKRRLEDELETELQSHIEMAAEDNVRSGMDPDTARMEARRSFGGVLQTKESYRDRRGIPIVESLLQDIRYAIRSLGKARGFSSTVIGSLSLGLAGTIVAFALINGQMLAPFPGVRDQDRLVEIGILDHSISSISGGWRLRRTAWTDYPDVVRTLAEGIPSLDGLASFTESRVAATLPEPRSLHAAFVSPNYFDVFGVSPEIGRTFGPEAGRIESASVAVISRTLWVREFAGDPSAIGAPIRSGGQTFTVIGVAPQGFAGTTENVDLWLPIVFTDLLVMDDPTGSSGFASAGPDDTNPGRGIRFVGRMADGVGAARVETELGIVAAGIVRAPDAAAASDNDPEEPFRVEVSSLSRFEWDEAASILLIPVLVLVISCVNIANLFLVRASRRGREVALRLALGASRLRLVRNLVIESLILAMAAALVALGLAWSGLVLLAAYQADFAVPLDGTVVAGALATAFLTALTFGLAPAFQAARQHPSAALGTSPEGSGGTRSGSRVRRALVAGQVALSLGLLAIGFQLTSGLASWAEPPVRDPDRILLASIDLDELRVSTDEIDVFYSALLERASRLPGVEAVGLSGRDLWWSPGGFGNIFLDPGPEARRGPRTDAPRPRGPLGALGADSTIFLAVGGSAGGDFFKAVGLDLVQGREFVEADWRDMPEVAILTERLASELFDGSAVGRSLSLTGPGAREANLRIVGIVESPAELSGQDVAAIFFPSPFFPSARETGAARTLYVRSQRPAAGLAPAIHDLVAQIDPRVPILELATLDQKIRADMLDGLVLARAGALLGIVALLLASVGLYGVTSYSVAMRAHEIAVRMALGARPDSVLAMVLRQAATLVMIGFLLGGVVAIVAGRLIQAEIYGVAGVPFGTLGGAAALLAMAMLLASILPARRAARMDPNVVLREE